MAKIKITKPGEDGQTNPGGEGTNGAAGAVTTPTEGDNGGDEGGSNESVRTATVVMRGRPPVDVEYPADATDPFTAAVDAFKASQGIWSLPEQPEVQQHQ